MTLKLRNPERYEELWDRVKTELKNYKAVKAENEQKLTNNKETANKIPALWLIPTILVASGITAAFWLLNKKIDKN